MKGTRKLFSIITALALCLTLLPGTAWAEGETPEDKSGGWVELLAVNLPREETVYTAGSGTITWTPELNSEGTATSGTVTLNNAAITADQGGIILPVPFTLALEGSSTITTRTGSPVSPEGVECAVFSRLTSLTITGPGSLTINSAGRAIEAFGDLTIRDGANVTVNTTGGDHAVYSGNIKTDDINIERGNITIEDSTLFITANSTNPPLYANMGKLSIKNSHVYVKSAKTGTQYGVAAISGQSVSMKDSDVAAIGSESQAGVGVIRFSRAESDFVMDGGILYVENTSSGGYDFDYSDPYAAASNNAVICYKGNLNYMIVNGDNIQYANCTYDESSHKVTSTQIGYISGSLTWNEKMPVPQDYFVYLYTLRYDNGWNYIPAALTIPAETEAKIPALGISRPGSKLINNGTLTSVIGIRNFGTIEGSGKLNASVQTRETVDANNIKDTFTAHGDATFWTSFTKIGTTSNNGITTQNIIVIPAGASLTVPAGATLDATASGTITVETLVNYYTNNGTLIVNGTAKFPAGTDLGSLGTITGTGQVIIGDSTAYPVTVTGGTADKSFAKAGEIVALTPEEETGKIFKGWTATSGGVTVGENNAFIMPDQAVAITARYAYIVAFDSQGGSAVENQNVENGGIAAAPADPVRTGHTFEGWYTDRAGGSAYDFNSAVTSPLTLYAKWEVITYTVSFDSQGGSETDSVHVDYGTKLSRPADPIREGYVFGGWYREAACATAWDFDSDTVAENTSLYAKWEVITYTVSFDSQGGTEVNAVQASHGSAISEPQAPAKEGFLFEGWYTDGECKTAYDFNSAVTSPLTLYAKWTPIQYVVTFHAQGGSETDSVQVDYGTKLSRPADPIREGYVFGGWYREAACATAWDFDSDTVAENTSLYAKWEIITYTVSFDSQGGTEVNAVQASHGSAISEPQAPAKEGFLFEGWYTDGECKTAYDFDTAVAGPFTLYAKWRKVLPNPPAGEGNTRYNLVMDEGVETVPDGLKDKYTTTDALENAMKVKITNAAGVSEDNIAVYDVTLLVSQDGGQTWTAATKENFPTGGLTITLPYPEGTNSSYVFTVAHMFTTDDFGRTPGDTETPTVTNTPAGIRFAVAGLSPISVGWKEPAGSNGSGGGGSASAYVVTIEKSEHGKVTASPSRAAGGSRVTLTVSPDDGYEIGTLTVADRSGKTLDVTDKGDGTYTFVMPGGSVSVRVAFNKIAADYEACARDSSCPIWPFTDADANAWYHDGVHYCLGNGLMSGYGDHLFGPNAPLSRAQLAQILYNREGRPAVNYLMPFADVSGQEWYAEAAGWAASQGVVSGYGNGMFGPNDNITREQLAVMLWRYAGSPAAAEKELAFVDIGKISDYAIEALQWAVEQGIMQGKGGGILDPRGGATRAEVAAMLMRFLGK